MAFLALAESALSVFQADVSLCIHNERGGRRYTYACRFCAFRLLCAGVRSFSSLLLRRSDCGGMESMPLESSRTWIGVDSSVVASGIGTSVISGGLAIIGTKRKVSYCGNIAVGSKLSCTD
jgi:hypothetical protein